MPLFPRLPLLDLLFPSQRRDPAAAHIALVCVQHLVETTGSLFEKLIELGIEPNRIHVLGKLYSTDQGVQRKLTALGVHVHENGSDFAWGHYSHQLSADIDNMWQIATARATFRNVRRIIVLDDGGANIASVPPSLAGAIPTVGIEQTMSGIRLNRSDRPIIPFIGVGFSAAKLLIEPEIIKSAIIRRVHDKISKLPQRSGVVGQGFIGNAVIDALRALGSDVVSYDARAPRSGRISHGVCGTLAELYQQSDIIWGCTGADHLSGHDWIPYFNQDKTLISCSSKDSEYNSLLRVLNANHEYDNIGRLADIVLRTGSWEVSMLCGGFPINFARGREVEPAGDIQLTRALMLAAVHQAMYLAADISGSDIDLDPIRQVEIVSRWFDLNPGRQSCFPQAVLSVFENVQNVGSFRQIVQRHRPVGCN